MAQINSANTSTPDAIQFQLDQIARWLSEIYGAGLLGIYLHGSLAMGCFNTQHSDLDLLAITGGPPSSAQFHATASTLLAISQNPVPVEISLCHYTQLHPWQYPPPFDFHFSEIWRARMEAHLAGATDLFALEQKVLSKWEGAEWALRRIPAVHAAIVVAARACYAGKSAVAALQPEAVQRCVAWIVAQV